MEFANHEEKVILEYKRGILLYKNAINKLDEVLSIFENSPWGIPEELEAVFKESQGNETLSKLKGEVESLLKLSKMI